MGVHDHLKVMTSELWYELKAGEFGTTVNNQKPQSLFL